MRLRIRAAVDVASGIPPCQLELRRSGGPGHAAAGSAAGLLAGRSGNQVSRRRNMSTLRHRSIPAPRPNFSILCDGTASSAWNTLRHKTSAPAPRAPAAEGALRGDRPPSRRPGRGKPVVPARGKPGRAGRQPFLPVRLVRADRHLRPVGTQARREVADLPVRTRLRPADALVGGGLVLLRVRQFPPRKLVLRVRHRPRLDPGGRSLPSPSPRSFPASSSSHICSRRLASRARSGDRR